MGVPEVKTALLIEETLVDYRRSSGVPLGNPVPVTDGWTGRKDYCGSVQEPLSGMVERYHAGLISLSTWFNSRSRYERVSGR